MIIGSEARPPFADHSSRSGASGTKGYSTGPDREFRAVGSGSGFRVEVADHRSSNPARLASPTLVTEAAHGGQGRRGVRVRLVGTVGVWILACATLAASDFWRKKDFTEWSDTELKQMMTDSPWSKRVNIALFGPPSGDFDAGGSGGGRLVKGLPLGILEGQFLLSSSPGGLLPRGPHQNRTRRFPPSGSSADVAHGDAPQIRTRIRGTGRGYRSNNATNLGQVRRVRLLRRRSHLYQCRSVASTSSPKLRALPLTPK